jgi:hypothetical protein
MTMGTGGGMHDNYTRRVMMNPVYNQMYDRGDAARGGGGGEKQPLGSDSCHMVPIWLLINLYRY